MRAGTAPDHGSLALLAQSPAADLRPLLLRVHVQNFADARRHDAAGIASFEAIALGLIPLVPDDVLSDVARMLRCVSDAPSSVVAALAERLGFDLDEPSDDALPDLGWAEASSDLLFARDVGTPLSSERLSRLVERGLTDPRIATALLDRPEPSVFDRAALYCHATGSTRAAIRLDLRSALASVHVPRPIGAGALAAELLEIASRRDVWGLLSAVASHLGVDPQPFDLDDPAGQELCLFALVALGLDDAECVRVLLLLDISLSRSVAAIFHLAYLARQTPRPVAAFLAGYERMAPQHTQRPETAPPQRTITALRTEGRADSGTRLSRPDRTERDRAPSARRDLRL